MGSKTVSVGREELRLIADCILKIDEGKAIDSDARARLESLRDLGRINVEEAPSIGTVLKQLGTRPGILGYEYLKTAIKMVIEDRSLIKAVTKEIYPRVAEVHNTTPSRVERAIRHAIEVSCDSYCGDNDLHDAIFGNSTDATKGKPTNTHFIAAVAEYMCEE